MLKSMTGFGRASFENESKSYTIEVKSVNHRYLDVNIRMPRALLTLEEKMRKIIKERVNRGKVDVFVTYNSLSGNVGVATLNKELAHSYIQCLSDLKNEYNIIDDISVSLVSRFPEVIKIDQPEEDIEEVWKIISKVLDESLDNLIEMREVEGNKLKEDILIKLNTIENNISDILVYSKENVNIYRKKLHERINELINGIDIDEGRITQEVAIFADRACIDEEIVRLGSHINQMRETLKTNDVIGRKLDFIVQEMNREVNTIGSKANNIDITNITINIKNEVEKIREQIQNIE
ncbi:MAG: YicC/YloC family endoribonuclease [Clostridiaceae bacterium]